MFLTLIQFLLLIFILVACQSAEVPGTQREGADNPPVESLAVVTDPEIHMPEQTPDPPQPTLKPPPSPTPLPTTIAAQLSSTVLTTFEADDVRIQYNGRFDFQDPKAPAFDWSGSQIAFNFSGTSLTILLQDGRNSYNVVLDERQQILATEMGVEEYLVAENLDPGPHQFTLSKRNEAYVGAAIFKGLKIMGGELRQPSPPATRRIEFIGDSITTGYGNEGESPECWFTPQTQNADKSYAAMTAQELNADHSIVALSGLGIIHNLRAGSAGSTETAIDFIDRALGLNPSVVWPADRQPPDAVVINLGTNDFSSDPFPAEEQFISAYIDLLGAVRARYPDAVIFSLSGPLMLGPAQRVIETAVSRFRTVNEDELVKFVSIENNLEPTAEDFGCDFHPNVNGHRKIAAQLIPVIADQLDW